MSASEYAPSGGLAVVTPPPSLRLELELDPRVEAASPLNRLRCAGCGYGACCRVVPDRCPMCQASMWEFESWRPFTGLDSPSVSGLRL